MPNQQESDAEAYFRITQQAKKAGEVKGRHYSTYTGEMRALLRAQRYSEAVTLLLQLIDAVEAQAKIDGFGIAAYYYDQLIIMYRKMQAYDMADAVRQRYLNSAIELQPRPRKGE